MDELRYQDLSRFSVPPGFRGRSGVVVQLWWIVQALLFHTSPQFLYGWRRFLLRLFGAKIGRDVIIRPSAIITYPWMLTIDDYAWVGDKAELYNLAPIHIGAHAVVSQGAYLCTGGHDYQALDFAIFAKPITVEPEAWVATQAFVAPGVRIGRGAIVAARSVVTKDIPPGKIAMGTPAVVTGERPLSQKPV